MRVFGQSMAVVSLALTVLPVRQTTPPKTADQVLAEARVALGGDKLAAVKSFVVTGRTRRLSGNNLVPVEFEVLCELPDKYLRKDEVPAQENEPTSSGFNADKLIQIPAPPPMPAMPAMPPAAPGRGGDAASAAGARGGAPPPGRGPVDPRAARVLAVKQDFARLTLGMFAASFDGFPLTFAYAGRGEAPQGVADVLDVKAGTQTMRLFVNSQTHLPVMVRWQVPRSPSLVILTAPGQPKPDTIPPGALVVEAPAPPAATASQADKDAYTQAVAALRQQTLAKPVDHSIYYSDFRDVNGMKFPFKHRRAVGPDTIEETTFDGFRINPKIDPRRFEVVK